VGGGFGGRPQDNAEAQLAGGGGGASITPSAFIIMEEDEVFLLSASKTSWEGLVEAVPGVAKKLAELAAGLRAGQAKTEAQGGTSKEG
jgi:uncharacterized spore protein YtfJ